MAYLPLARTSLQFGLTSAPRWPQRSQRKRGRLPASDCRLMAADLPPHPLIGRFWTKADKGGFWPGMVCPLMTQSGQMKVLSTLECERLGWGR